MGQVEFKNGRGLLLSFFFLSFVFFFSFFFFFFFFFLSFFCNLIGFLCVFGEWRKNESPSSASALLYGSLSGKWCSYCYWCWCCWGHERSWRVMIGCLAMPCMSRSTSLWLSDREPLLQEFPDLSTRTERSSFTRWKQLWGFTILNWFQRVNLRRDTVFKWVTLKWW